MFLIYIKKVNKNYSKLWVILGLKVWKVILTNSNLKLQNQYTLNKEGKKCYLWSKNTFDISQL